MKVHLVVFISNPPGPLSAHLSLLCYRRAVPKITEEGQELEEEEHDSESEETQDVECNLQLQNQNQGDEWSHSFIAVSLPYVL